MVITASYKKTVKGYARYAVPGGGMVVFSANLFGKGVEPPATIVLDNDAFAVVDTDSKDRAKVEAAAAKAAEQLTKLNAKIAKIAKMQTKLAASGQVSTATIVPEVAPWQAEILAAQ
jgi:hypothetical protein